MSDTRQRPSTSAPGDGSRTITIQESEPIQDPLPAEATSVGAIRVRATNRRDNNRVVWDENVVDNEGCGRKSSKICCIYHKPRNFDESSSEEDSSDSGSDSDCDGHGHSHPHSHRRDLDRAQPSRGGDHLMKDSASEPNAYEQVPKGKSTGKGKGKDKTGVNIITELLSFDVRSEKLYMLYSFRDHIGTPTYPSRTSADLKQFRISTFFVSTLCPSNPIDFMLSTGHTSSLQMLGTSTMTKTQPHNCAIIKNNKKASPSSLSMCAHNPVVRRGDISCVDVLLREGTPTLASASDDT
ncbi:Type 1 phosphatases regulator [Pleurotus pulmonarius]